MHTDAVQAVGHLPVDFAASGVDLLTSPPTRSAGRSGPAPCSCAASHVVPHVHGGGQERQIRSGTLDTVGHPRVSLATGGRGRGSRDAEAKRLAPCATGSSRARSARARHPPGSGCWTPGDWTNRLPGNAHLLVPGCEGDSLLYLLDAAGVECSTGSACQAGVPQPSHVLLAMGHTEREARGALRLTLGPHLDEADVEAFLAALPAVVERARRAAGSPDARRRRDERGVDSAVAAARMLDAGHEVVGVHLALSRRPPRRCARRPAAAAPSRTPATPVGSPIGSASRSTCGTWPSRFRDRRRRGLRRRVCRGPHPQPLPALQRADQVRRAARQGGGPGLRRGRDRALRPDRAGARRARSCTGPSTPPRTSPTCSGCSTRTSWPARSSRSVTRRRTAGARGGRRPRFRWPEARLARHLLHPRRRHPWLAEPVGWGSGPVTWWTRIPSSSRRASC
jgi:hypothetical protein